VLLTRVTRTCQWNLGLSRFKLTQTVVSPTRTVTSRSVRELGWKSLESAGVTGSRDAEPTLRVQPASESVDGLGAVPRPAPPHDRSCWAPVLLWPAGLPNCQYANQLAVTAHAPVRAGGARRSMETDAVGLGDSGSQWEMASRRGVG
jgi:hypothetical protein